MNINSPLYSRATKSLRDANARIPDKLVFVYPMLFEQSLFKYANQLRDFLSALILKEIFVSNSINLITNVSKIHALTDPQGNELDVTDLVSTSNLTQDPYGMGMFQNEMSLKRSGNSGQNEQMKRELDAKIKERLSFIQKLIANDPDFKPLRPMTNMITMDNMVDVPVIVGTKAYTLDSLVTTLLMVVVVSEKERISLSDMNDVNRAFKIVSELDVDNMYKLLNNIARRPEKDKSFLHKYITVTLKGRVQRITNTFGRARDNSRRTNQEVLRRGVRAREPWALGQQENERRLQQGRDFVQRQRNRFNAVKRDEEPDVFTLDETHEILKLTKNNIKQAHLFFKFCVNEDLAKMQHGLNLDAQNIGNVFVQKKNDIDLAFEEIHDNFMKMVGTYGRHIYYSYIYMFYPQGTNLKPLELMHKYVAINMNNKITNDFLEDDFLKRVQISFSEMSAGEAERNIKIFSGLCEKSLTEIKKLSDRFSNMLNRTHLTSITFNQNAFLEYTDTLEEISSDMMHHISRMRKSILGLISGGKSVLDSVAKFIEESFSEIEEEMQQYYDGVMRGGREITGTNTQVYQVFTDNNGDPVLDTRERFSELSQDVRKWSQMYIYFLFLYNMQVGLCKLMSIIDVDVKLAGDSLTSFPNYSLVLPSQIVVAITNAIAAKGWRDMVNREGPEQRLISDLNDNYMKGIVKFFINKLNVPNIFIVDERSGKVFYRLMHQQAVKQISLNSIDAYSQLIAQKDAAPQFQNMNY